MAFDNWNYGLILKNVRKACNKSNVPIFRLEYNPTQDDMSFLGMKSPLSTNECPFISDTVFYEKLRACFRKELARSDCKTMTQRTLLFFLLGGYLRFVAKTQDKLSFLFNGNSRATGEVKDFARDLNDWKAIPETGDSLTLIYIDREKKEVPPDDALSLVKYISKRTEVIIRDYCDTKSQEAIRKLLHDFATNCYDAEEAAPQGVVPMDLGIVKILSNYLGLLDRMAEYSQGIGKQPKYLAEGLTWLMVACLLRGTFPADRAEFYDAMDNAHKAADEMGIFELQEIHGSQKIPYTDSVTEQYVRLMNRFHYIRDLHPSIRMMEPDPDLFPKGLPVVRNSEWKISESQVNPVSIKDMVRKGWVEHKHLLLVGEGGLGKTVSMLAIPDEEWVKELMIPAVYIMLNSMAIYEGKLNDYIKDNYEGILESIIQLARKPREEHPNLLLLLDGYNEIPSQYRDEVDRHIKRWMNMPGVQIILTSRISFTHALNFLEYKLITIPKESVREYLLSSGIRDDELPEAKVYDVINTPLMLTIYLQIEGHQLRQELGREPDEYELAERMNIPCELVRKRMRLRSVIIEDAYVYSFLKWETPDSASNIIWNYLQMEAYRCVNHTGNITAKIRSAEAILLIAPFICFGMIKKNTLYLDKKQFQGLITGSCYFYKNHSEILHPQISMLKDQLDEFDVVSLFEESAWREYAEVIAHNTVLFKRTRIKKEVSIHDNDVEMMVYVPCHQEFRDSMAYFFVSNCMSYSYYKIEWRNYLYPNAGIDLKLSIFDKRMIIEGTFDSKSYYTELDNQTKQDLIHTLILIVANARIYDYDKYLPDIWILMDGYGNEIQRGSAYHPAFIDFLNLLHANGVPASIIENELVANSTSYIS